MNYYWRLPKFEYTAATTIKDVLFLLEEKRNAARVIAGGTDLLVQMKNRVTTPDYLIGLKKIKGLDYIRYSKTNGIRLGPLSTIGAIEKSPVIRNKYSILAQATTGMASPQIRSLATVAGNICTALPSADTIPPLIVLGTQLKLQTLNYERTIAIEDFFRGPRETILKENELLTEIQIPCTQSNSKGIYLKHSLRNAMSLATVSVAVMIKVEDNCCCDIRIALGAVAPIPFRA